MDERVDVTAVFPAKAVSISSPAKAPQAELILGIQTYMVILGIYG